MSSEFFDRVFDRINKIDAHSLKGQLKRLAGELAMMETVFRSIQEGVMVVNASGELVYANGAAEQLLSFSADKLRGKSMSRYFGDIDFGSSISQNDEESDDSKWSRLVTREIEITYPKKRILSFYAVPLPDVTKNNETNTLIILRDVTREREQEASALEDERLDAVRTLAASVAHEIGNPLNALNIHLQLLSRELKGLPGDQNKSLGELVSVAKNEVSRLDSIITQFLQALRHNKPNLEPGNVVSVLMETLSLIKIEIENRRIEVKVTGSDHVPNILLDPGQIKQVFFNLIKNAMEAMPDGGALAINISYGDKAVRINFTDNGVGIPAESLGRIFEPYHTTKARGTGLGLMIVQRIIQEHGGEIAVSSKEGEGTCFSITLPRAERRIRKLVAPDGATEN